MIRTSRSALIPLPGLVLGGENPDIASLIRATILIRKRAAAVARMSEAKSGAILEGADPRISLRSSGLRYWFDASKCDTRGPAAGIGGEIIRQWRII